ncbi:uncharacterized protein LOC123794173 isoform X3 [Ursus americanus]|uniref:uncharacterized protein LOC123794173 isoform X3 n=1 Tax=Ursus americanus TaxID=9643 RepID=UPI001E6790D3|nr:uncharacterized protein LOC123794173 isoform X3 [Ursus americanus]
MAAALAPPPSAVAPRAGGRPPRSPLKCQVRTPLRFLPDVPPPTSARAFSEAAWVRQRAPTRVRATRAAGGAEPSPISLGFSKKVNLDPSQNQRRTLPLWKENPIENPVLHGSETHHIPQDQQLACLSNSVAHLTTAVFEGRTDEDVGISRQFYFHPGGDEERPPHQDGGQEMTGEHNIRLTQTGRLGTHSCWVCQRVHHRQHTSTMTR